MHIHCYLLKPLSYRFNDRLNRWYLSFFKVLFCGFLVLSFNASAAQPVNEAAIKLIMGNFSQGDLKGWEEKIFSGNTNYVLVVEEGGDNGITPEKLKKRLRASSDNSASGLFKEQRIDLHKTPYLHWSWKTEHLYSGLNELKKAGDDFVARIYIVIDGGMFMWKTKALNYVWSSAFKHEQFWPNPYTSNATMFAVESGPNNLGKWMNYKRNVRDDLKTTLGKEVRYIDAIAVMTDSDSSGQKAITYYGDIYFTAQ